MASGVGRNRAVFSARRWRVPSSRGLVAERPADQPRGRRFSPRGGAASASSAGSARPRLLGRSLSGIPGPWPGEKPGGPVAAVGSRTVELTSARTRFPVRRPQNGRAPGRRGPDHHLRARTGPGPRNREEARLKNGSVHTRQPLALLRALYSPARSDQHNSTLCPSSPMTGIDIYRYICSNGFGLPLALCSEQSTDHGPVGDCQWDGNDQ
jgi:hypothetical protein